MLTSCLTKEEGEGEDATKEEKGPDRAWACQGSFWIPGTGRPLLAGSFQALFELLIFFKLLLLIPFFFLHATFLLSFLTAHLRDACSLHSAAHHRVSAATFSTTCFLSPSISALSDVSHSTAAHWNPLGCPNDPVLPATRTVPEPWQKSHNTVHFQTTSTAAAPSTLEGSPSPSDSTLTALNVGIPILHSTHPLYGGALPPPQSCPVDTGCHSPPPSGNHTFLE